MNGIKIEIETIERIVIDVETYEILKQLYDSLDDISCNLTGGIDSLEDLIAAIDNFLKDKKNIKIFD